VGGVCLGQRRLGAEELAARAARAAAGLASLGVGPGDGVAMLLRNDLAFYEAALAASAVGAYPVAVNWHYTVEEARYVLEDSEAKALVVHADLLARLRPAVPEGVAVLAVPTPPEILVAYEIEPAHGRVPPGEVNWEVWLEGFSPRTAEPPGTTLSIIYTSGTTGRPKGVKRPAYSAEEMQRLTAILSVVFGLDCFEDPGRIVTAVTGPIYHSAPNTHAIFSFRAGATVHLMPRFDAEGLLALIERERITHLHLVPIMFERLLKLPPEVRGRYDVSSLRFVVHAAAPCSPATKRAMIAWWGPIIHEYYGATEIGPVTFLTAEEWLSHPGSVGRALAGAVVRVLGDDGRQLGPGEVGEIVAAHEGVSDFTYHRDEAKRRAADRGGLFAPGDVGYFDEDGYLYLCDRKIDMIISGGVNIYPAAVEAALLELEEVADCAVFGIPDDEYGEVVHAIVQPQPGASLSETQVKAFLRTRVAGFSVPRRVEFRDELPREDSGKIFKRKLRDPYWEGTGRTI
jgi:long-chain acyl-CoA synthetase